MRDVRGHGRPDFDHLINEALSTYANADPGIEQRVLARIAARRASRPRFRWMVWGFGLTAVACLLLLMKLMHRWPAGTSEPNAFNASSLKQAPQAEARFESRPVKKSGRRHHAEAENAERKLVVIRLPKRDTFPTPHRFSPAEQVLVDFAERAPKADRESFVEDQKQVSGPIAIEAIRATPIQIPPLQPPHPGEN